MDDYSQDAIASTLSTALTYCKFITPNDAGITGGHQSGFLIGRHAWSILFDRPGRKGEQIDRYVSIKWPDETKTNSRFIYYGAKTRNEYRITRIHPDFRQAENVGNLFILCKESDETYLAYILSTDTEIENYLTYFNLQPTEANRLVSKTVVESSHVGIIEQYAAWFAGKFPSTKQISQTAQQIYAEQHLGYAQMIVDDPDTVLLGLIDTEYELFKAVEKDSYRQHLLQPFKSVDALTKVANEILNRRKSRAGKALEHHLSEIFDRNGLSYTPQGLTEKNHKPDFIMPSIDAYHSADYDPVNLTFLGAKTTCKDRWRQVLTEASKIPDKHLFTLQPGVSSNQLREMRSQNLTLVIPAANRMNFPPDERDSLLTLKEFILLTKAKNQS